MLIDLGKEILDIDAIEALQYHEADVGSIVEWQQRPWVHVWTKGGHNLRFTGDQVQPILDALRERTQREGGNKELI